MAPEQPASAFVADRASAYRDILCIHEERTVSNDNTVRYKGLSRQIPPSPLRHHFVKARVRVHEYPDGHLAVLRSKAFGRRAVFHGPRRLARYDGNGGWLDDAKLAA